MTPEQQLADLRATHDALLQAIAHDLRAPLRHFTAYGALVQEALDDAPPTPALQEAQGFLATMDQSAKRMALMIDGLLALVRAGRAPLRMQPVALDQAVAQARAALGFAQADRAAEWCVAADLPTLEADPALLQELLVQLLGNAVKFTRHVAQPRIAVQADVAPAGQVAFTVQDNGAGFDPARAGTLFGVFQRLHRESEFEGVGTGLALCRAIAQRHGGAITACAVPGGGCTVRVEWPAQVA